MTADDRGERRKERLARNEVLFREVNERVEEISDDFGLDVIEFVCECGNAECTVTITLTRAEYEELRTDPLHFAVSPGHAIPAVEDVVSDGDRFQVVRKHEEEAEIARSSDPRA